MAKRILRDEELAKMIVDKTIKNLEDCCYRAMGYCTSFENCPYRVKHLFVKNKCTTFKNCPYNEHGCCTF